jgi:hypothetical protein
MSRLRGHNDGRRFRQPLAIGRCKEASMCVQNDPLCNVGCVVGMSEVQRWISLLTLSTPSSCFFREVLPRHQEFVIHSPPVFRPPAIFRKREVFVRHVRSTSCLKRFSDRKPSHHHLPQHPRNVFSVEPLPTLRLLSRGIGYWAPPSPVGPASAHARQRQKLSIFQAPQQPEVRHCRAPDLLP